MNEPKKRGRPPKAEIAARTDDTIHPHLHDTEPVTVSAAQAYAQRVWDGQSVSLSVAERLRRVKAALEGQGMSMEGVEL